MQQPRTAASYAAGNTRDLEGVLFLHSASEVCAQVSTASMTCIRRDSTAPALAAEITPINPSQNR